METPSAKGMKEKEVEIQKKILQYLKLKGIFNFRVNTGGLRRGNRWVPSPNTTKGVADIIAIKQNTGVTVYENIPAKEMQQLGEAIFMGKSLGRFVAIEVKRPGAKPSADQLAFLDGVKKAGGIGIVAYSVADVQRVFE